MRILPELHNAANELLRTVNYIVQTDFAVNSYVT